MAERLNVKAGTRFDYINSGIQQPLNIPQPPPPFPAQPDPNFNATNQTTITKDLGTSAFDQRHFPLLSAFGTADYKLTDGVTIQAASGYAERPPTLQ